MSFSPAYIINSPDEASYKKLSDAFRQDIKEVDMGSRTLPLYIAFNDETHTINIGYALDVMQTILPNDSKVMEILPIRKTLYGLFKDIEGDTFQAGNYSITRIDGNPFTEKNFEIQRAEEVAKLLKPKHGMTKCNSDTPSHQVLAKLLETNQGVCLGEIHIERVARLIIAGQMEEWHTKGLRKIFLEVLRREFNPMLKHYYMTPNAQLPAVIMKWLDQAEENIKRLDASYQQNDISHRILKFSKHNGIEVYGISSALSFVPGLRSPERSTKIQAFYERGLLFNAQAAETIQSLLLPGERFVVLCGRGHLGVTPFTELDKSVPGLDQFLNIPAIVAETCKSGEAPMLVNPNPHKQIEHICRLDPVILAGLKTAKYEKERITQL